ncbi:MAG: hypothetical protein PVJ12_04925, partial [Gammaproteobacteria bacterium]
VVHSFYLRATRIPVERSSQSAEAAWQGIFLCRRAGRSLPRSPFTPSLRILHYVKYITPLMDL